MNRLAAALLAFAVPLAAHGHGFAQRYDLPVPLALYVTGAAAAVALSFVVIAFFLRGNRSVEHYPRFDLLATPVGRIIAHPIVLTICRLVSVLVLLLVIVAGLIGGAVAAGGLVVRSRRPRREPPQHAGSVTTRIHPDGGEVELSQGDGPSRAIRLVPRGDVGTQELVEEPR